VKRLFHFSFLILDSRQVALDAGSARLKVATYHKHRINSDINALSGTRTQDPMFERAKIFHALDGMATVLGQLLRTSSEYTVYRVL
jgi:hypothetical protein